MIFSKTGIQHAMVTVNVGNHPDRVILVRILAVEPVGWIHPNWGNVTILTDTATPIPNIATADYIEWDLVENAGTYNFSVDILVEPSPDLGAVYFVPGASVHESIWQNQLSGMPIQSTNVTFENVEVTSEGGKVGTVTVSSNDTIYWTQAITHFMRGIDYGMGNLLYITAKSPVNIIVTAPNGLRMGYDALSGSIIEEIPGAFYCGPNIEPQVIAIPDPVSGNYKVDTFGTGNGSYTIAIESLSYDGLVTCNQSVTGTVSSGSHYAYICSMEDDGSLSSIEPNYLTVDDGGHGIPTGEGWYEVGSSASFSIDPTIVTGGDGIRYVFTGWIGSGKGSYTGPEVLHSIIINNPITETAQWKIQYYLTLNSKYGTPAPSSGWYDNGATAYATLTDGVVSGGTGTQYVFTGWSGDATGTGLTSDAITMNTPKTATAQWKTQYYLTINVDPSWIPRSFLVTGAVGWYDAGTLVPLKAASGPFFATDGHLYFLLFWYIDSTPASGNPITVSMDGPHTATAHYMTPQGSGSITSKFNGNKISASNFIWFNSNFKASGLGTEKVTIWLMNSKVTINGVDYDAPNAQITFDPDARYTRTSFDATTNTWKTTVPIIGSDEIFLSGFALQTELAGGATVTWKGDFFVSASGISINWKWGAAVYTKFTTNYTYLNIKAAHTNAEGNDGQPINNSDHAGTPENYKQYVIGGARGGGGSNYTGSWSGTQTVIFSTNP